MTKAVLCSDIEELYNTIIVRRNIETDDLLIKIGLDGSGGFMKVCMSLIPLRDDSTHATCSSNSTPNYASVKRLIILGIVPDIPESYDNVKLLWQRVGLRTFPHNFCIATDLKLCNILLGIMSHGSSHPCSRCDAQRDHLDQPGSPRTALSLHNKFWDFAESGDSRANAKKYGNVIHTSIVKGRSPDSLLIEVIPPPELHLLTGPVNTLYKAMEKLWPNASQWLVACHVQRVAYHGGNFTGNSARTLLKNVDRLQAMCPLQILPYVAPLRSLDAVVSACYGAQLRPEYTHAIRRFQNDFLDLGINISPKIHAIFFHVPEFCQMVGKGLGSYSEQASESVHHDFQKIWENYKIQDQDHPRYGEQLLKAVTTYNSRHL